MTTIVRSSQELAWQAQGSGPPVLLIAGTPGIGAQFSELVTHLVADRLVVTYDRRPGGAPVADHADDAAALVAALTGGPPVVYGTSNGAAVALELVLRHPDRVRGVMLHEMPLLSVVADPEPVGAAIGAAIGAGVEAGGPRGGLDAFLRFAYGDAVVDGWSPQLRERMLGDADRVLSSELPTFQGYRPDPEALAKCRTRAAVLVGDQQQVPLFAEAAEWLAGKLRTQVTSIAGAHGPQFTCPAALADAIRRFGED